MNNKKYYEYWLLKRAINHFMDVPNVIENEFAGDALDRFFKMPIKDNIVLYYQKDNYNSTLFFDI